MLRKSLAILESIPWRCLNHVRITVLLVSHVNQFEQKLASAIMTAFRSPMGPAHLSIPLDVLRAVAQLNIHLMI